MFLMNTTIASVVSLELKIPLTTVSEKCLEFQLPNFLKLNLNYQLKLPILTLYKLIKEICKTIFV